MGLIKISRGVPKYNIQIGPIHEALKYNPTAILSVTDTFEWSVMQHPQFLWIPINEIGKSWGYGPFYATKRILDWWILQMGYENIFVGCSAGVHRSPMVTFCWLLSQPGATFENVDELFYGGGLSIMSQMYKGDIEHGYLPPDLPVMYKLMNEQPEWCLMSILQAMLKYERITYMENPKIILTR